MVRVASNHNFEQRNGREDTNHGLEKSKIKAPKARRCFCKELGI